MKTRITNIILIAIIIIGLILYKKHDISSQTKTSCEDIEGLSEKAFAEKITDILYRRVPSFNECAKML